MASGNTFLSQVFRIAVWALVVSTAATKPLVSHQNPTAETRNGTVEGVHLKNFDQDHFLGVPFAQTPVGDLRLRHPASLNSTWDGKLDATKRGLSCVGYAGFAEGLAMGEGEHLTGIPSLKHRSHFQHRLLNPRHCSACGVQKGRRPPRICLDLRRRFHRWRQCGFPVQHLLSRAELCRNGDPNHCSIHQLQTGRLGLLGLQRSPRGRGLKHRSLRSAARA